MINQNQWHKVSFLLLMLLSLVFPVSSLAATLHAIIAIDTNDPSIGASVKIDLRNMQNLVADIAQHTRLATAGEAISGSRLTVGNVNKAVESLSVGTDDVVIFYYSGHGFNPGGTKWPAMNLEDGDLGLKTVREKLRAKNPRLLIVMADTCNGFQNRGGFRFSKDAGKPNNYKVLFLKYRGVITASSSKPGQYSWGNERIGGLYTDAFLKSLNRELASKQKPTWKAVMERANAPIQASGSLQEPQYKFQELNYVEGGWTPPPPPPPTPDCRTPDCLPAPPSSAMGTCVGYFYEGEQECCRDKRGQKRCWMDD